MRLIRLAGLAFIVAATVSFTAVSAASANAHFRWQDIGLHFTGSSGTFTFRANTGTNPLFRCNKSTSLGIIASLDLIGSLTLHFLECVDVTSNEETCEVGGVGESPGLITLPSLHAVLGLILPRAGSGVGLLVLPGSGRTFTIIAGNKCAEETALEGGFAAEVTPVARAVTLTSLTFALTNGTPNIKEIDVLGALVRPSFTMYGHAYALEALQTLHWRGAIEVV